jgi:hypothetical protein
VGDLADSRPPAACADDLAVVRSLWTIHNDHGTQLPALLPSICKRIHPRAAESDEEIGKFHNGSHFRNRTVGASSVKPNALWAAMLMTLARWASEAISRQPWEEAHSSAAATNALPTPFCRISGSTYQPST